MTIEIYDPTPVLDTSKLQATLVIPTIPGRPYYNLRTKLDNTDYTLRFAWNQRLERWSMDILSIQDIVLVSGIKLVSNWPLLRYYQWDLRVPQGEVMAVDLSPDLSPPGIDDLGVGLRCELTYFSTVSRT